MQCLDSRELSMPFDQKNKKSPWQLTVLATELTLCFLRYPGLERGELIYKRQDAPSSTLDICGKFSYQSYRIRAYEPSYKVRFARIATFVISFRSVVFNVYFRTPIF